MSETKHTPGPWNLDAPFPEMANRIVDADGFDIVDMGPGPSPHANAAFIVQAVNAHDDLVGALSELVELLEGNLPDWYLKKHFNHARAALAKAKGE